MDTITFTLHGEQTDGALTWWAESDDMPGFTAVADTLVDLQALAEQAAIAASPGATVRFRIGDSDPLGHPVKFVYTGEAIQPATDEGVVVASVFSRELLPA